MGGGKVMGRGGPTERREEQEKEALGYRGSHSTITQIRYIEKEKNTEGSQKRSRSPHGRQAKDRTRGKANQRLFQQEPVAPSKEGADLGGPDNSGEEEAPPAKVPRAQATTTCPECNKKCISIKVLNKH